MAKRFVTQTTLKKVDDEYQVLAYDQHSNRFEEADYFTDDLWDAKLTAQAMTLCECGKAKDPLAQHCSICK